MNTLQQQLSAYIKPFVDNYINASNYSQTDIDNVEQMVIKSLNISTLIKSILKRKQTQFVVSAPITFSNPKRPTTQSENELIDHINELIDNLTHSTD